MLKKWSSRQQKCPILWQFSITMPHLLVCKMKTAASWKKTDPILETRKIALWDVSTRRKIIFLALDPPLALIRWKKGLVFLLFPPFDFYTIGNFSLVMNFFNSQNASISSFILNSDILVLIYPPVCLFKFCFIVIFFLEF